MGEEDTMLMSAPLGGLWTAFPEDTDAAKVFLCFSFRLYLDRGFVEEFDWERKMV